MYYSILNGIILKAKQAFIKEIGKMATLAEIRAKLKAQEANSGPSGPSDNAIYPHWNIPEGTTTVVRFLPDADTSNTFFWQERLMIRLPFSGIKGDMNSKPVVVQVPCVEMWQETCPVLTEVRGWFKDSSLEEMGRKYWKKRSYIFQGFVNENPLEETTPENPIRRFVISPSIFTLIKDALMDPDIQEIPTDYDAGLDFRITKTTKGQYADYSTSKWARKETALTEEQRAAVDTNGLFTLSDFLPKRPGETEIAVIKAMFEASVDGQPYDVEQFGNYFRPYGVEAPAGSSNSTSAPAPTPSPAPTAVDSSTSTVAESQVEAKPVEAKPVTAPSTESAGETPKGDGKSAEDILAMIRSRQKA